jgi:hypothetical protein
VQGVPQGFLRHVRYVVRVSQDATADLPLGHRHLLQRGQGKSALALSRDLDCQYKTAFVLAHALREVMALELKGMRLGGCGEMVERVLRQL